MKGTVCLRLAFVGRCPLNPQLQACMKPWPVWLLRYNKDLASGHQKALERLQHEQAQVDEYVNSRRLDQVCSFASASFYKVLLSMDLLHRPEARLAGIK